VKIALENVRRARWVGLGG